MGIGKVHILPLVIVADNFRSPVLGRQWLNALWPVWRTAMFHANLVYANEIVCSMIKSPDELANTIFQSFSSVFVSDISKPITGYAVHLPVKPDAIPIFRKAYSVPCHLRETVKNELEKLQSQGVLYLLDSSEWATPLVVVRIYV